MQFVKANCSKKSSRRFPCDCHFCENWLLPIQEVVPIVRPTNRALPLNVPSSTFSDQPPPLIDLTAEMSSDEENTIHQTQAQVHHAMSSSDEEEEQVQNQEDPLATNEDDEADNLQSLLEEHTSNDEDMIEIEERPVANTQEVFDILAKDRHTLEQQKKKKKPTVTKRVTFGNTTTTQTPTVPIKRMAVAEVASPGPSLKKRVKTIKLSKAQQIQLWEAQSHTMLMFLMLVWENMVTPKLLRPLFSRLGDYARRNKDLELKKRTMQWSEAVAIVLDTLSDELENCSWGRFKSVLSGLQSYTIFISDQLPEKIYEELMRCYEDLVTRHSSSSPHTPTTSTSSTIAHTRRDNVDVATSEKLKTTSGDNEERDTLFGSIGSDLSAVCIPCSISKKEGERFVTYKSDGKPGSHVLKLDLIPYEYAAENEKSQWWKGATWRITTSYSENSELAHATQHYLKIVEKHFARRNVGNPKREQASGYSGGYGNFQRRH